MSLYEKSVKIIHIVVQLALLAAAIQLCNSAIAFSPSDKDWAIMISCAIVYIVAANVIRLTALWCIKSHADSAISYHLTEWQKSLPNELPEVSGRVFYEFGTDSWRSEPPVPNHLLHLRQVRYIRVGAFYAFKTLLGGFGVTSQITSDLPLDLFVHSCRYQAYSPVSIESNFWLLVSSNTFEAVPEGEHIPVLNVTFYTTEKKEARI